MPSPVKPSHHASAEGEKHKQQLGKEIRDMVFAITHGVTGFQKQGSTNQHLENDDEHGLSMITLAGTNNGATMRSEIDEKYGNSSHDDDDDEVEALNTYVNSNFQAINNSIMLGGSYSANDPGVHMDISDFFTEPQSHHHKAEKQGKKKEKEASKS
ncbi:hypothetical protein TanjilG_19422 [Lupinus angustifolius]|uniref:Uncharacterized protein n=1 Tax=Lupinus angustifolius TaxID=3871 RepID=A0A4P1R4D0_LUPAN|nr:PREDICTED: uncharacterized protein LOC109359338 [Lupinus angustifolius]OIW01496.1 hypothetical protein TanjilG_19422 [Lupinus angustifolius]